MPIPDMLCNVEPTVCLEQTHLVMDNFLNVSVLRLPVLLLLMQFSGLFWFGFYFQKVTCQELVRLPQVPQLKAQYLYKLPHCRM